MGKHSLASTHKRTFNKTMAVALAAGVSFGGVQVVSAQSGHELSGVASAAEITDKGLVSNLKITAEDGTEFKQGRVTQEEHDAFVKDHGKKLTMSFDVSFPDSAKAGDSIPINFSNGLNKTVEGNMTAKDSNGTTIAYLSNNKIFVSDEAGELKNRKAHFEVPLSTNNSGEFALTLDKNLVGKPVERNLDFVVNGEKVFERTETATYKQDTYRHNYATGDAPRTSWSGYGPNVDTGVMISYWNAHVGHANQDIVESIGDKKRDAEFRYTVNDKDSKIFVDVDEIKKKAQYGKFYKEGKQSGRDINHFTNAEPFPFDVEVIRHSDQDVTVKYKGIPANRSVAMINAIRVETAYVPGKKITVSGDTVTVGEPKENFDERYEAHVDHEYSMDAWSGFASADDVKRSATLETRVKGKDADDRNEAVKFSEGEVTDFELELKNTGNIGARHATVTLPEGMYLPNGETSFEHDFGDAGFPPGSTKTIPVKGVQVLKGTNPNNFTVDMFGYETLSDPAWTTVDDKDIYIDGVEITDDNKLILHRNDGEDLDVDLPESTDVKVDENGDLIITRPGEKPVKVPIKHTIVEEVGKPGSPDRKLVITDENGDKHEIPLFDEHLKTVEKDENGDYRLIMEGGKEHIIEVGDTIVDIKDDGNGNLIIKHKDGTETKAPIKHTVVTETGEGTPEHKVTITTPDGESVELDVFDVYVTDIKKNEDGDYDIYRSDIDDGKTVWKTIKLKDLRDVIEDLKGKDAEQDARLDKIEDRLDDADKNLDDLEKRVAANETKIEEHRKDINDILIEIGGIENEIGDIKTELERLDGQDIKEVRENEDGSYTLIRNNGDEVKGNIDVSGDIVNIEDNGDGSITLIRKDGSKEKVDLKQVEITEANEGTPNHTVTITSPNGDTVTFNVFDKYVTDVKKNEDGDYDIYRSDIDNGKTVWKTIVLSDMRDQIGDLQDRFDKLEKKDGALQDEIDRLKERMDQIEDKVKDLDGRTSGLEDEIKNINARLDALDLRISAIDARIDVLEGRVDKVEDTNAKWAKCYSGIGMAAIPAVIAAPILGLAGMDIPVLKQANTDIQKRIGVYNPELAKAWGQYGGIAQAVAGLLGLMGAIGAITYASNECAPYNQTDDVKDTKLGQLSSKHVKDGSSSSSDKKVASSEKKPGFFSRIWNKITGK